MKSVFKIGFLFIIAAMLAVSGCGRKGNETKEETKETAADIVRLTERSAREIGLTVIRTELSEFNGKIAIPARIINNQDDEALVGSLVQGRVKKVFVKPGDFVKAGQDLMHVEGLEIGVIKAEFLNAKSNLDYKKSNFDRQKMLNEQKIGSQKNLQEALAEYEKAKADFIAADKKIHSIGLNDNDITNGTGKNSDEHSSGILAIKAPISGVIAERNVVIGQMVDGTTNAFRIINSSTLWADGQVSEKDIRKLNGKGQVEFVSYAYPDEKFAGNIIFSGQTVDEKSRTITLRAELKNRNNLLKAQMFGEMKIASSGNSRALLIPLEALVRMDNEDYVFVMKDTLTFEKRSVKRGQQNNDMVEITEGLKENESVAVKGAFYLKSELLKSELEEE